MCTVDMATFGLSKWWSYYTSYPEALMACHCTAAETETLCVCYHRYTSNIKLDSTE